ncbi:SurA N-terminal domain-containing protein [uncultured Aeromicrobium sp.]|uniref:SurA N-terminal domain-containing protein n=1 Tax=uncultured Aeromicrobium sp. TaxID=337820 RepID=UPI0025CDFFB9|nr:SurA N-terminal domain-containing protein [uncultured Aeromicrobium sp.]
MSARSRLVVLAVVAMALAGCGPVQPGSAAVVGDTRISMAEADEVSEGYCALSLATATAQGASSLPNGDVRRQALSLLIMESVAEQVAEQEGIGVPTPGLSDEETEQARQLFGENTDLVVSTIARNERALAVATQLAEHELGARAEQMSEQQLAQAGQQLLLERAGEVDIEIDPRFGMSGVGEVVAATGSLSVPGPVIEGQELPDALTCRA